MATKKQQNALAKIEEYFKMVDAEEDTLFFHFDDPTRYTKTTDVKLLNDVIEACYKKYIFHYGDEIGDGEYDYNSGDRIYYKKRCNHEVDMSQIVELIYAWIDEHKYPTMLKMLGENMKAKIGEFVAKYNNKFNKLLNERVMMYDKREYGTSRKYSRPLKFKADDFIRVSSWFDVSDAVKLRNKLRREDREQEERDRKASLERYAMRREEERTQKMRVITTFNDAMIDAINVAMNITDAEEKKRMMSALAVFGGYAPS
jgi:hypothetical protein